MVPVDRVVFGLRVRQVINGIPDVGLEDAVESARLRSALKEVIATALLRTQLLIDSLLFHVFRHPLEQVSLKRCEVLLRKTARINEFIKVLVHKQLELRYLFL